MSLSILRPPANGRLRSPSSSDNEKTDEKIAYAEEGHVEKINLNSNVTAKYVVDQITVHMDTGPDAL